jgi:preprotein translocase subunit SecG
MGFLVGLLTVLLVLDSLVLILLVLIQLPKKDAGAGLAFGGGATDALFGAGSGTVLTKVTKYAAATFFALAFVLAVIQKHRSTSATTEFERQLANPAAAETAPKPMAQPMGSPVAPAPTVPTPSATNLPTSPAPVQ